MLSLAAVGFLPASEVVLAAFLDCLFVARAVLVLKMSYVVDGFCVFVPILSLWGELII